MFTIVNSINSLEMLVLRWQGSHLPQLFPYLVVWLGRALMIWVSARWCKAEMLKPIEMDKRRDRTSEIELKVIFRGQGVGHV